MESHTLKNGTDSKYNYCYMYCKEIPTIHHAGYISDD